MKPQVTVLASGLKLLSFQGVTTFQDTIIVATVEADLVRVASDGTLTPWVNLDKYGIPTGLVGMENSIVVAVSAQESGHFLIRVTDRGKITPIADLSNLVGEFGAPFAIAARTGYYPYYLIAISTDVSGSAGIITKVTPAGRTSVLATLTNTPFGVGIGEDYAIVTQENGEILKLTFDGASQTIANLEREQFGIPLDLTRWREDWMMTTSSGWLVALKPDGTLEPALDLGALGWGLPTTLTTFNDRLAIATQTGNLLQLELGATEG